MNVERILWVLIPFRYMIDLFQSRFKEKHAIKGNRSLNLHVFPRTQIQNTFEAGFSKLLLPLICGQVSSVFLYVVTFSTLVSLPPAWRRC